MSSSFDTNFTREGFDIKFGVRSDRGSVADDTNASHILSFELISFLLEHKRIRVNETEKRQLHDAFGVASDNLRIKSREGNTTKSSGASSYTGYADDEQDRAIKNAILHGTPIPRFAQRRAERIAQLLENSGELVEKRVLEPMFNAVKSIKTQSGARIMDGRKQIQSAPTSFRYVRNRAGNVEACIGTRLPQEDQPQEVRDRGLEMNDIDGRSSFAHELLFNEDGSVDKRCRAVSSGKVRLNKHGFIKSNSPALLDGSLRRRPSTSSSPSPRAPSARPSLSTPTPTPSRSVGTSAPSPAVRARDAEGDDLVRGTSELRPFQSQPRPASALPPTVPSFLPRHHYAQPFMPAFSPAVPSFFAPHPFIGLGHSPFSAWPSTSFEHLGAFGGSASFDRPFMSGASEPASGMTFYKGGQFVPGGGRAPRGGGWY